MLHTEVLKRLKKLANPKNVEGMARFGINTKNTFGVSVDELRKLAKKLGNDHNLALQLWQSGIHEARIIAALVDEPELVTEQQMERWAGDFDSWDVCDQVCMNLFDKTKFAWKKTTYWTSRREEFVKRAGFALIASLASHDKNAADKEFLNILPAIKREASDERNYVKKAINWALRQIGKRSLSLNRDAIEVCNQIAKIDSPSAKWIASNAKWELESEAVQKRLKA